MRRLHLLHEDLRIVGHHVSVYHRPEGYVVACGLDVLVDKLPEALPPQAVHQLSHVPQRAADLLGQDLGVHHRQVVDGPAGDGRATLSNGPLEQACRKGMAAISPTLAKTLFFFFGTFSPLSWHTFSCKWWGFQWKFNNAYVGGGQQQEDEGEEEQLSWGL